jgi:hypothetical protein
VRPLPPDIDFVVKRSIHYNNQHDSLCKSWYKFYGTEIVGLTFTVLMPFSQAILLVPTGIPSLLVKGEQVTTQS